MRSRFLAPTFTLLFTAAVAFAAAPSLRAAAAPVNRPVIPLWPAGAPGSETRKDEPEKIDGDRVSNIHHPSLTAYLPAPENANGTAVIVAPGGGFRWLSINNEGWKIAKALNERGVAAFVLKYRLIPTPPTIEGLQQSMNRTFAAVTPPAAGAAAGATPPAAEPPRPPRPDLSNQLADAEAAYALILSRAAEWHVDTKRIGMIGFSAGAGLTMHSTLHSKTMKLAFIGPIYGGMGPVEVPKNAPPMFAAIASDDFLFRGQFGLIKSWFDAGVPVEFHLYQNGGHGFGLGYPGRTSNRWFDAFMHWLDVNGFLAPKPAE